MSTGKNPLVNFLGWLLLAASFQPLFIIVVGSGLGKVLSEGKMMNLAILTLPTVVLTVAGAVALINYRVIGGVAIYLAFLLVKSWKLDETRFPREFSKEDQFYIGRAKGQSKMIVQLVWRKSDGRFTGMLMGSLAL